MTYDRVDEARAVARQLLEQCELLHSALENFDALVTVVPRDVATVYAERLKEYSARLENAVARLQEHISE